MGGDEIGRSFRQITVGKREREREGGREGESRVEKMGKGWDDGGGIPMLRGMCNPSITSVNRDRAAAGLQVYRTDNADRSIGFSEMQRRG